MNLLEGGGGELSFLVYTVSTIIDFKNFTKQQK